MPLSAAAQGCFARIRMKNHSGEEVNTESMEPITGVRSKRLRQKRRCRKERAELEKEVGLKSQEQVCEGNQVLGHP